MWKNLFKKPGGPSLEAVPTGNPDNWDMYCIGVTIPPSKRYHKYDSVEDFREEYIVVVAWNDMNTGKVNVEKFSAILLDPVHYAENMYYELRKSVFIFKQTKSDTAVKMAEQTFKCFGGKNEPTNE